MGIQWLKTLGPIVTDYANLSMQFQWLGLAITLQGIRQNSVSEIPSQIAETVIYNKSYFRILSLKYDYCYEN